MAAAASTTWTIIGGTGAGGLSGPGGGGGGAGGGPGSGIPANVTILSVTGTVDPNTGMCTVEVQVTPPSPLGPFMGCHLFCEIPDQSTNVAATVGSTPVGRNAQRVAVSVTGPWNPTDIGRHVYVQSQQPWDVTFPLPKPTSRATKVDPSFAINSRLYAVSYSLDVENDLVQANQTNPTPNQTFTLEPGIAPSAAGTNVTTLTTVTGDKISLVVTPKAPVNVNGKLQTPFIAIVSDTPQGIDGWGYRLVLTYDGTDPTDPKQQFILTGVMTQAGIVPSGPADGISVPHSFYLETP